MLSLQRLGLAAQLRRLFPGRRRRTPRVSEIRLHPLPSFSLFKLHAGLRNELRSQGTQVLGLHVGFALNLTGDPTTGVFNNLRQNSECVIIYTLCRVSQRASPQ